MSNSVENVTATSIRITFTSPEVAKYLNEHYNKKILYVVSLINIQDDDEKVQKMAFHHGNSIQKIDVEIEQVPNNFNTTDMQLFIAIFKDLQPGTEYKIIISTNYNGQPVIESNERIITTLPVSQIYDTTDTTDVETSP